MNNWREVRLGDVVEIISGGTPKTSISDYWDGDIPWISIKDFAGIQRKIYSTEKSITSLGLEKSATNILHKGDIIISARGTVGEVAQLGIDMAFNQSCYGLKGEGIINDYLFYLLKHFKPLLVAAATGATFGTIIKKTFDCVKIKIPDLETQEKIAHILSTYDELIENNNRRIEILEKTAEEIYKEWFVRMRFPGYKNTKLEKGIPEGWKVKRVLDIGEVVTGKTPSTLVESYYGKDIMFVKTPDMHDKMFTVKTEIYLSKEGSNSQLNKLLPVNSIMVSCIGTGGVVSINMEPSHTNQQINSIILKNIVLREWAYFTLKTMKETIELLGATGATMTNLSKGKFEKIKILYPTRELLIDFNNITKDIFEQIKNLQLQNQNLIKQRDLLLPRLMNGTIEVK